MLSMFKQSKEQVQQEKRILKNAYSESRMHL